ncbi:Flp family type IVb pilin [Thioclava sp. NG1]|uniref:Flp family type IVb pilin n=1 Tax=Thioclava sp. NG1 TaxID=2182426 RepID=UPI000D60D5DB|nr:Flp family type IVb pilin [Thioclava sp. NG1]PWE49848.1 Flp family type IVb pilin [Thioclava sp. NG1]
MKLFKLASLRRLKNDEEGVTVVEYGIALAIAVGIGSAIYTTLGTGVYKKMAGAATIMGEEPAAKGTN